MQIEASADAKPPAMRHTSKAAQAQMPASAPAKTRKINARSYIHRVRETERERDRQIDACICMSVCLSYVVECKLKPLRLFALIAFLWNALLMQSKTRFEKLFFVVVVV